jgi:hypothetical protein
LHNPEVLFQNLAQDAALVRALHCVVPNPEAALVLDVGCPWLGILDNEHAFTAIIRSRKVAGYMKDETNYLQRRVKPNASEAAVAGLIGGCV